MALIDKRGTDGFPVSITDIQASAHATDGNEVHMYPGEYPAPTGVVAQNYAYVGMGDRDSVIVEGDMTIADGSSGTITFKNLHFRGSNAVTNSGTACVTKLGNTAVKLHFINCKFSNAEHGINQMANLTSTAATGAPGLVVEYCDMSEVDQAIVSNCNAEISFSQLGTTANTYYAVGDNTLNGAPAHTVTVRASTSGGSNSGNMTETVLGLIS